MKERPQIRKGYGDGPFGQIHWRMMEAEGEATRPDLYCLHPAPFSGLALTRIMPHLAKNRRVIAPDYPGYGGSDGFKAQPSISEYAEAMLAVISDMSPDTKIDLMGFHTGNLVAAELSLSYPDDIGRLALVDIPSFDPETSAQYLEMAAKPFEIEADIACLSKPWGVLTSRIEGQGADRAFELFAEQLRPGKNMNSAFHAAFTYDAYSRISEIDRPTLVLATQSILLDATRWAGAHIPGATVVEHLDITSGVLDEAEEIVAAEILKHLDGNR